MSLRPIAHKTPGQGFVYNVTARLANPLDSSKPITVGGACYAPSDLDALDEFSVRVLLPFASAGFPVEVYSITAASRRHATILLPQGTTDDRKRDELNNARHVLDVLDRRGIRIDLRVIEFDPADRRPQLVASIINTRRNARRGVAA